MQSMNFIEDIYNTNDIGCNMNEQSFVIVNNDIITEVSQPFVDMTQYSANELINKNIEEVIKILKVGPDINLEKVEDQVNYFLFTKYLEVRFLNIEVIKKIDKQIYIFREKQNSRFENNNHFLERFITENITGIGVFTASDFTLIKANETYLNNLPEPYNTKEEFYGKSLKDVISCFKGSSIEKAWTDAVIYNKSVSYKEQQGFLTINRNRYWDYTIIPVSINNQVEYIVVMLDEVTEHVANREHIRKQSEMIEQRNKQLEAIVESIDDILLILDNKGNIHKQSSSNINFCDELTNNINKFFDFSNNPLPVEDIPYHKVLEKGKKVKNFKMKIVENEREKYTIINGTPIFNLNGNVELGIFAILDITDLMEKKRQIKKQKELLEKIISNVSNGIFIFDKEGKQLIMNEEAKKLVYPIDSINSLEDIYAIAEYFYEDGRSVPMEEMPAYRALRGEIVDGERMLVKQAHRELVLEFKSSPIYDNDGNIDMIITSNHNITELVNQNKIIKQQKELLESIIENVSDAIIVYNKDKNVLLQNEASKKFIYQPENFKTLGDRLYMTRCLDFDGNEISTYDLPAYKSFKGEKITSFMVTFQRPDKTLHCRTSSSPIYDEYGNINNVVVCMHDITDIIKQEEQIKEQKEQLEAIINNMQEPILVFDKDEKYIIKNNVAIELLETIVETIEDSVKAKRLFNMNGSEITYEETPAYYARQGKTVKGKIIYFEANGRKEYLIMNAVPIMDSKGNFLYGILSGRNITEFMESQQNLKLAQEQLLKAEHEKNETLQKALEMKDEFLSLISHEFKTPINVISTAIQGLNYIYGNELSDKVKQYLWIIRQNTFRQLRLVNNLLDITRANAGRIKINKKNIDIVLLTKAITESVYGYAAQKGVKVSLASSFKKKIIGIDDEKYERIILNLLSNAIKFTGEGNSISVTLRSIKGNICIAVKDDGIGIPPDKIDIIFDRFGQVDSSLSRQAEGTGIGLSLVKMFVKALGGSISVKSKVGKGSTFTVMLPNEKIVEEEPVIKTVDLMDNHLVEVINVEFSDIYL